MQGVYCMCLEGRGKDHATVYRLKHKIRTTVESKRGRRRELQNQNFRLKNQEFNKTKRREVSSDTGGPSIPKIIQPLIRMRKYKEIADE
jgi:hypothetical protein